MSYTHHHHGNVIVGRVIVAVACLLVLAVNGLILKHAAAPSHPIPALEVAAAISLLWVFTGAAGICLRKNWGRPLVLTILYAGSFGFFVSAIILVASEEGSAAGWLEPILIGMAIYLIISLLLTHSKHVRRLTSRAYE